MEAGAEKDLASDVLQFKTGEGLAENLPAIIKIFESNEYAYLTNHWPGGQYPHQSNIRFEGVQ